MKMVIAGGRDFIGSHRDLDIVIMAVKKYGITEIVSGKQKGADHFGEYCADMCGLPVKPFLPHWNDLSEPCILKYRKAGPYNALAGPNRNNKMAEYTDYVFLFSGGKGTASMRKEANAAGKKIIYDDGWIK